MKQVILAALLFFSILIFCMERTNPMDENSDDYIPPAFEIVPESGSVSDGDTVHHSTVPIHLQGNNSNCIFRFSLNGLWTDWQDSGSHVFESLSDADYTVSIQVQYKGGTVVTDSTIGFVVITDGFKPAFSGTDTLFYRTSSGIDVHVPLKITGKTPMTFSWLKNGKPFKGQTTDTLSFTPFSDDDTGFYQCIAENEFGLDTGRVIVISLQTAELVDTAFFTLTVLKDSGGVVSRSLEKERYTKNDTVTLYAIPGEGYSFDYWDGDISGTDSSLTFVVTKNIVVKAVFSQVLTGECMALQENEIITEAIKTMMTTKKRGVICVPSGIYNKGAVRVNGLLNIVIK